MTIRFSEPLDTHSRAGVVEVTDHQGLEHDLTLKLSYSSEPERIEIEEFTVRRRKDGPPVTVEAVQHMPKRGIIETVWEALRLYKPADIKPGSRVLIVDTTGQVMSSPEYRNADGTVEREMVRYGHSVSRADLLVPGRGLRPRKTDDQLRRAAAVWLSLDKTAKASERDRAVVDELPELFRQPSTLRQFRLRSSDRWENALHRARA